MVQLMGSVGTKGSRVKLEEDDDWFSKDQQRKRCKFDPYLQMGEVDSYNPLEDPSPLGLRLRKTPSFLDMVQMKLSQEKGSTLSSKKDQKVASASIDKLKASNFPATLLKIGTWEYKSRYEGDLVAKCYFAKHKIVWEVLDGGLKNKIEIQWSDIVAIKAKFPEDGPESLDIVLARQPLFFRETNPQPRKHTLWQAASDFTGGQASIHRQHFLQCKQGFFGRHFEKLIQCDPRLNFLSRQTEVVLECPYFEQRVSGYLDLNQAIDVSSSKAGVRSPVFALQDTAPSDALSPSFNSESQSFMCRSPENSVDSPSSISVLNPRIGKFRSGNTMEQKFPSHWDQIKVPGIQPSMSMSDLVNHIGQQISEKIASGDPNHSGGHQNSSGVFEEITQYLLSDSQLTSASDEKSIMSRVNSLYCLLQKDTGSTQNLLAKGLRSGASDRDAKVGEADSVTAPSQLHGESNDVSARKQAPTMSRKDSVGDLLLNLPRIASLPRFLFNF